jgi:cytochrome c553
MIIKKPIITITLALMICSSAAWAGGDVSAGETKAASCVGCHGADGMGSGDNPPITGLEADYFTEQMAAYKSGTRENAMMQMFAGQLSEEDMADIAAYYASLGE